MKQIIEATQEDLSDHLIFKIMAGDVQIGLDAVTKERIEKSFRYIQDKIHQTETLIYGVNTGFGSLCNVAIPDEKVTDLQVNLIRSHACGAGGIVPLEVRRLILFTKIRSLSYGYSGVSLELVGRLMEMYNLDAIPVIYEQGSLGASGDLAPLAHLSLPLIGEGEVEQDGRILSGAEYLQQVGRLDYTLQAKEGLALINGTQFSLSYLTVSLVKANRLQQAAIVVSAMSLEGFDCRTEPFTEEIHAIRPGNGQPYIAAAIRNLISDSEHLASPKAHVQDPYSFRCIPQVHGASYNALKHIREVVYAELNSVTDNPNVFIELDAVMSGGNFHAQPLALASDYLAIAASELGSISERRTYLLISGQRGLPPFLTANPGLESGFMIAQYTAAAIASQNKQYATPASVDSIVSSNGQEDHVSMAANAGVKALKVVENLETLLAIEWQIAAQAVDMRGARIASKLRAWHTSYRQYVSELKSDRVLQTDFEATKQFFKSVNYFEH